MQKTKASEQNSVCRKGKGIEMNTLLKHIDGLLKDSIKETLIIAIDGNSGSGKSWLAKQISESFDCNVFHTDDFFLRPNQRTSSRYEEIGGNIDYERLNNELLLPLQLQKDITYRKFDCSIMKLGKVVTVSRKRMNILEGVYSLHPYFGNCFDLKLFLTISAEKQNERIRRRNGEAMLERFKNEWIPMENRYFQEFHISDQCDKVIIMQ